MGTGVDRLVIDRRPGPTDFPARFAGADTVMLEKRRGFHGCDGPVGTVLQSRPWPSCARLFLEIRIRLEILVPTLAELQFVRQSPARQLIFEHVNRSFVEDCRNQLNRAASWLFVRTGAAPRRGAASNNRIAARFNQ